MKGSVVEGKNSKIPWDIWRKIVENLIGEGLAKMSIDIVQKPEGNHARPVALISTRGIEFLKKPHPIHFKFHGNLQKFTLP